MRLKCLIPLVLSLVAYYFVWFHGYSNYLFGLPSYMEHILDISDKWFIRESFVVLLPVITWLFPCIYLRGCKLCSVSWMNGIIAIAFVLLNVIGVILSAAFNMHV